MANYTILIIDDDPMQHAILADYLKLSGYEVIHAENGEHGFKLLETERPALILLDVQMPGMDGFQFLEAMRKKAAYRNVAVFLLTGLDRRYLKIKGLELGADDYITKPFDLAELRARINAVLRRADMRRQLEGVMEGDLADVGISDLLQSMELGMKTAFIKLDGINAEVVTQNGELLHVRQGNFMGEAALVRIFLLEKGYFSIKFNEIPSHITTGTVQSMTSALMNAANTVDEVRAMINRIGVKQQLIKIIGDLTDYPEIEAVRSVTPATFVEMIVAMKGDLKDNIKIMVNAIRNRKLKIEQH